MLTIPCAPVAVRAPLPVDAAAAEAASVSTADNPAVVAARGVDGFAEEDVGVAVSAAAAAAATLSSWKVTSPPSANRKRRHHRERA